MSQTTLIPLERMMKIAHLAVKKHCNESHPDFEDFVQDVLLGILQRQDEFDPALGKPETFVVTVANQKAYNRVVEQRRREKATGTNRTGCIPFQIATVDAGELDARGDLACIDESVLFARFFSMLDSTHSSVLKYKMAGYSERETRHILGISVDELHEVKKSLSENFDDFRFFQNNNATRGNY